MSKRKSEGTELRMMRSPSPEASKSSSADWGELSLSSSSSSSVSYSSKLTIEDTCVLSPETGEDMQHADASETKAMALVGCPRCFMYVMLSEEDPKCPKCKSTAFLEFFKDENFKTDN